MNPLLLTRERPAATAPRDPHPVDPGHRGFLDCRGEWHDLDDDRTLDAAS